MDSIRDLKSTLLLLPLLFPIAVLAQETDVTNTNVEMEIEVQELEMDAVDDGGASCEEMTTKSRALCNLEKKHTDQGIPLPMCTPGETIKGIQIAYCHLKANLEKNPDKTRASKLGRRVERMGRAEVRSTRKDLTNMKKSHKEEKQTLQDDLKSKKQEMKSKLQEQREALKSNLQDQRKSLRSIFLEKKESLKMRLQSPNNEALNHGSQNVEGLTYEGNTFKTGNLPKITERMRFRRELIDAQK